jgi:hypothetical protein
MRDKSATRRRIIDAAYALFYRHGYARIGVDAIAELLAAVFEFHHGLALKQIEQWGAHVTGGVPQMVDAIFADLARWAAKPRWTGPGFTRLVMELADLPGHPARAIASRHKAAVEAWFAREFARRQVKAAADRARDIVLLLEGTTALMLVHGDSRYAAAAAQAAKRLLTPPQRR